MHGRDVASLEIGFAVVRVGSGGPVRPRPVENIPANKGIESQVFGDRASPQRRAPRRGLDAASKTSSRFCHGFVFAVQMASGIIRAL